MRTLQQIHIVAFVGTALLIEIKGMANSGQICTGFPADTPDPAVVVCESQQHYTFQIVGQVLEFDKVEWQNRARQLIHNFGINAGISEQQLATAHIKFWLSVPESAPGDAHGRAVVDTGEHRFVVNLPVSLDVNQVTRSLVADLAGQTYPDYLGHRVGSILVKKSTATSQEQFLAFLKQCGATGAGETAGGWTSVFTRDFSEIDVIDRIEHDPLVKAHVEGANLNSIFEWIAWRQPVFEFSLAENPVPID